MAGNNDRWRDSLYSDDTNRGWREWNRSARDRERGALDRAGDEVRSWFGDDDAERRRRMDEARESYRGPRHASDSYRGDRDRYVSDRPRYNEWASDYPERSHRPANWNREDVYPVSRHGSAGPYSGRGPRGYQRSDDRIREDVCDRLTYAPDVDATDIEVQVTNNEVILRGAVHTREEKRRAEDIAEDIAGVRDVHNEIRVTHAGTGATTERGVTELDLTGSNATPSPIGETPRSTRSRTT